MDGRVLIGRVLLFVFYVDGFLFRWRNRSLDVIRGRVSVTVLCIGFLKLILCFVGIVEN